MDSSDILIDAFSRIQGVVHRTADGLSAEQLTARPDADANSIAWLLWHLTRIQDDHVADVAGREQVWTAAGFEKRFGLSLPARDTGYAHSSDDVAAVQVDEAALLVEYYDAVHDLTVEYVKTLKPSDLDGVVDTNWDPPVTLGVRLVSVIADGLQHAGQAAYVRGLLERDCT
jgi:uncharacterized damage-inducible protein DinB